MDDKCEECYKLWSQNFAFLPWRDLVEKNKDKAFAVLLRQVRSVMSGSTPGPTKVEELQSAISYSLEIDHGFVVMNEKEFKRNTGLSRVPRGPPEHSSAAGANRRRSRT